VIKFKYCGLTAANQNYSHEDMKSCLNLGNTKNRFHLLFKNFCSIQDSGLSVCTTKVKNVS